MDVLKWSKQISTALSHWPILQHYIFLRNINFVALVPVFFVISIDNQTNTIKQSQINK